ncbi:MAG: gliding motility-associated C-terminal domain-containing protein [Bacteroidales bacterium]|nr:gliding motility-associated C-terminal domain-containing protein [Bacteroidales bacterium]
MKKRLLIGISLVFGFVLLSSLELFSQNDNNTYIDEPKGDYLVSHSNKPIQSTRNVDAEMSKLMAGARELKSRRDKWSYHYKLPNGRYGAEIYSNPVNYFTNGEWKPIIPKLKNSNIEGYAYVFDEMNGRILVPQNNNGNTKIEFENIKVSFHSLGLRLMDGDTELDLHNQKQIKPATKISDRIVHFSNVYDHTTEHIELGNDMFSFHLLLETLPDYLNNISSSSDDAYLEYDILVNYPTEAKPFGVSEDFISETGIVFVDENNDFVFNITEPIIFDSNNTSEYYKYKWKNIEPGKGILTMSVPISWLKSSERVFPVTIDPSVELYADNSGYAEAATFPTSNLNNVMKTGGKATIIFSTKDKYRGLASFNISSIPAGQFVFNHSLRLSSCYTNTGQFWVGYGTTSHNPSTGTGPQLYEQGDIIAFKTWNTTAVGTTEWHDYSMYNIIITQQVNTGQAWYGVKTVSAESNGSWPRKDDAQVDFCAYNNASDGDKPMLFVEYDTPPSINTVECNLTATASSYLINSGESVTITAGGTLNNIPLNNDFNAASPGSGWEATTSATYTNPSCAAPSLDGSVFLWMGDASPHPRRLISQPFDVINGGWISFDLKYSVQAASAPCEGPDEPQEGVALQYSLDNGSTWIGIMYFHPLGYYTLVNPGSGGTNVSSGAQTPFTSWANYIFAIPVGAFSNATKFRWNQDGSSGALYDNWGLDNIIITTPVDASIYWEHNPTGGEELTESPTVTTTYTAWITNGIDSCSADVTIEIDILTCTTPAPQFTDIPDICIGNSSSIGLVNQSVYSSAVSCEWIFENGTPATASGVGPHNVTWNTPGTHSISVTITDQMDLDGTMTVCSPSSDTTTITVHPNPEIEIFSNPSNGCMPLTTVLTATSNPAAAIYNWNLGPTYTSTESSPTFTFQMPGNYDASITITDVNGCSTTQTYPDFISVYPAPQPDFNVDPPIGFIEVGSLFQSTYTQTPTTWFWNFGDGSPVISGGDKQEVTYVYPVGGQFMVTHTVETQYGCIDSITKKYLVIVEIIIPNIFTPNDDGTNDFFVIDGIEVLENCVLKIFNRWGRLVYKSDNYKNDWDGKGMAEGVYYYTFITPVESLSSFHGTITLLR